MTDTRSLVFVHVPKTGGQTFETVLRRHFGRAAILQADADDLDGFAAQWAELGAARQAKIRCVHGHLPYGVHAFLRERPAYVTLLRDPIERFVSHYYYTLRRPEFPHHRLLVKTGMSLLEYAGCAEAAEAHDLQVRSLAGRREAGEPEDLLARARAHLEGFAAVGIVERFDESMLIFGRALGWRHVHYAKANVNKRRPAVEAVPTEARAVIRERSARDVALYDWAATRFAAALAARPISGLELWRYGAVNRAYTLATRMVGLPRALFDDARTALRRRAVARR
jgi:hypothetical protein